MFLIHFNATVQTASGMTERQISHVFPTEAMPRRQLLQSDVVLCKTERRLPRRPWQMPATDKTYKDRLMFITIEEAGNEKKSKAYYTFPY